MLYIDDREPAKVIAQLKQLVPDVELRRMDVGDYVIGDFAIERKELRDLLGSVYDARIWRQLAMLKDTYPHPCLIVEGETENTYKSSRMERTPLDESDLRLIKSVSDSVIMGWSIPIVFTPNYIATANRIADFYARSEKKHEKPRAAVKKQLDPKVAQVSMLQIIDGVGAIAASRLLANFTFRELVNVSDPNVLFKRTVGLNKKQAESVVKVFGE